MQSKLPPSHIAIPCGQRALRYVAAPTLSVTATATLLMLSNTSSHSHSHTHTHEPITRAPKAARFESGAHTPKPPDGQRGESDLTAIKHVLCYLVVGDFHGVR